MIVKNMVFKQWSAWVMLAALTIGSVIYFGLVRTFYAEHQAFIPPMIPFVMFTVVIVVLSILGHIIAAVTNLETASQPADERDKSIALFASHWSGNVLGFGVVMALLASFIWPDGRGLFHMIFAALVISQMTEYALQLWGYKRANAGLQAYEDR